jgi:hypothetical protein
LHQPGPRGAGGPVPGTNRLETKSRMLRPPVRVWPPIAAVEAANSLNCLCMYVHTCRNPSECRLKHQFSCWLCGFRVENRQEHHFTFFFYIKRIDIEPKTISYQLASFLQRHTVTGALVYIAACIAEDPRGTHLKRLTQHDKQQLEA